MAFKYTPEEKEAHLMMKELVKKPVKLKAKDFQPGAMIMYTYRAKTPAPYDANPLLFVLGRTRKHTYGINLHWVPKPLRKGIIDLIMKNNKRNIEKGLPLKVPKDLVMKIFRAGVPAFRKYLNNRISPKGVIVPSNKFYKAIELRSERFIGISADEAWKIAVKKIKRNKKHVARKDKGYK